VPRLLPRPRRTLPGGYHGRRAAGAGAVRRQRNRGRTHAGRTGPKPARRADTRGGRQQRRIPPGGAGLRGRRRPGGRPRHTARHRPERGAHVPRVQRRRRRRSRVAEGYVPGHPPAGGAAVSVLRTRVPLAPERGLGYRGRMDNTSTTGASPFRRETSVERLNQLSRGTAMEPLGIVFTEIGHDFVRGTMPVDERTRQPYGLLHGGASVLLAETLGSSGGNLCVPEGKVCVGIEINAN